MDTSCVKRVLPVSWGFFFCKVAIISMLITQPLLGEICRHKTKANKKNWFNFIGNRRPMTQRCQECWLQLLLWVGHSSLWWFRGGRNIVHTGFCIGWGLTVDDVHVIDVVEVSLVLISGLVTAPNLYWLCTAWEVVYKLLMPSQWFCTSWRVVYKLLIPSQWFCTSWRVIYKLLIPSQWLCTSWRVVL